MWTGECAAAWRLFLFNWIVIGFIGTAFALSLLLTTFSLAWYPFLVGCGFVAVYAAFALYNAIARNRRDPQVVFVLGGTAQIVLITLLMAPVHVCRRCGKLSDAGRRATSPSIKRSASMGWLS